MLIYTPYVADVSEIYSGPLADSHETKGFLKRLF